MPERVGVAVVGAGFMGGVHAAIMHAQSRATVRWVADLDLAAASKLGDEVGAQATSSLDEVLADPEVHLVVIATPVATHEPITARALAVGKHVLVEKPMVLRASQAERLVATAHERGLVLATGGNFRYAPKFVRARQLAEDQAALGVAHSVRVAFRNSGPDTDWFRSREMGGGALFDLGWHAVELCWWMLGKPGIQAVTACSQNITGTGDVEEQAVILLHFATGAVGQCDISWICPGGERLTLEVTGTNGSVSADLWQGMGIAAFSNTRFTEVWEPNSGWSYPEWEWIRNSGYEHQDRAVLDAVLGSVPMAHHASDAVTIVRALEAANRSAAQGRRVAIDE